MPTKSKPSIRRASGADRDYPLIVQSHLRWDFVWQRPQQLLSRFARTAPVLFIEEPFFSHDDAAPSLDVTAPHDNVWRAVPRLPRTFADDYDRSIAAVRELVSDQLSAGAALDGLFANSVQWFYTGMPAPAMLGAFNEIGVVYDCMDELAQFRDAPAEVARRERLLIANADVVFTGGYKLYQAKSALHHNVHFFGCGVDAAHFGSARLDRTTIPEDARFDSPVIGYFGVIDERLDYELIEQLAAGLPRYNIVMVGPTAKINPAELPHAPNIHWVGQRPYADLPGYVKAFDVCLMPFALNEATEFINPTKTLEYMAAGKPIVSSAVPDVITNFAPVVSIARSHRQFLDLVQRAAEAPDESLIADGIELAERSSWESIIEKMRQLIRAAVDEPAIISRITQETRLTPSSRTLEVPGA